MMSSKEAGRGKPRILFILHQASLTGAPIILCELVRLIAQREAARCLFLVMEEGPLMDRCRSITETHVWFIKQREKQFSRWGLFGQTAKRLYNAWRQQRILSAVGDTDLIISNTIANGAILERLAFLNRPVISYIHELPYTVRSVTTADTLRKVLRFSHYFLAGSAAVRNYLVRELKVDAEKTAVLHSSIDVQSVSSVSTEVLRNRFRMDHMISDDTMIVGVASTAEWRKGFDLWFPLVHLFRAKFPKRKVVFVWKGYRGNVDSLYTDLFDFRKAGFAEQVILLPHDGDSRKTIAAFDIHLLLSREDPYPLVVLEAACCGIPTVCFDDAGGAPEFVEGDAGVCVPYGNLNSLTDALEMLMDRPEWLVRLGNGALRKVAERHSVDMAASRLLEIVDSVCSGKEIPAKKEQQAIVVKNQLTKELL
jgi:glycosyltransferase involved in cell wall biosynthesis